MDSFVSQEPDERKADGNILAIIAHTIDEAVPGFICISGGILSRDSKLFSRCYFWENVYYRKMFS